MVDPKRHTTTVCASLLIGMLTRCAEKQPDTRNVEPLPSDGSTAPVQSSSPALPGSNPVAPTATGAPTGSAGPSAPAASSTNSAGAPSATVPDTTSGSSSTASPTSSGPNSGGPPSGAGGAAGAPDGAPASGGSGGSDGPSGSGGAAGGMEPGMGGMAAGGAGPAAQGELCSRPDVILCEDFESVAPGAIPAGFTATGDVAVTADEASSGGQSLRIGPASNGPRRISAEAAALSGLAAEHWGRIRFKVQLPHPIPSSGVIHSTLVAGAAQSPLGDPIEVRVVDTVLDSAGNHQYLYNVQPQNRAEFGTGSTYDYRYTDAWTCAEWHVDAANQVYQLFIGGEEVEQISKNNGAGNFDGTEIPEQFESLSFGWYNYQNADPGFTAWIDDIAVGNARIECTD